MVRTTSLLTGFTFDRFSAMRKPKDPNVWFEEARKVADDPATSAWFKNALFEAINRDPVDAAEDAEALTRILRQRAAAVQLRAISNASSKASRSGS
jgi:hypothetical protein